MQVMKLRWVDHKLPSPQKVMSLADIQAEEQLQLALIAKVSTPYYCRFPPRHASLLLWFLVSNSVLILYIWILCGERCLASIRIGRF